MTLRRTLSTEEQADVEKHEQRAQMAQKLREEVERFRTTFSLEALPDKLPLRFPSQDPEPLSFRALSWYTYPGWAILADPKQLAVLSAFYVVLCRIDFSPLRAEKVSLVGISLNAPGQPPFEAVSLFLCCLLRWEKGLGWKELTKLLAGPEGDCWRKLFGFHDGATPCASTMRGFYKALGAAFDMDLCPRFIELIHPVGLLPQRTTHPHTPANRGLPIAADGMLHEAHATMRCAQVADTCYQPVSAQQSRPCPAQDLGRLVQQATLLVP